MDAPAEAVRPETGLTLTVLLNYTVRGQLDEVRDCLNRNRDLIHLRGDVTDLSGRRFQNITGFQYAAWALDKEMCELILKYLPKNYAHDQLHEYENNRPDITDVYGKRFNFQKLLEVYDAYIQKFDLYLEEKLGQEELFDWWRKEVGGAQRAVPAWYVYAFCEEGEDKAWPLSDFTKNFMRDPKNLHWWFECAHNIRIWEDLDERLAIYRSCTEVAQTGTYCGYEGAKEDRQRLISCFVGRMSYQDRLNDYLNPGLLSLGVEKNLVLYISKYFSNTDLDNLALTSKAVKSLFRAPLEKRLAEGLLKAVVEGRLDVVKGILDIGDNKKLLYLKGDIKDLSGREFKKITAFQYAVWAGDEELWNIVLAFLPEKDAHDQLMALTNERPDITKTHGAPLSFFDPLLIAYRCYQGNYKKWHESELEACWQKKVGGAQRNMPAWFIYMFSEEGLDKAWPKKQMTRRFSRKVEHVRRWFELDSKNGKCGFTFAWSRLQAFAAGVDRGTPISTLNVWRWPCSFHDLENSATLKIECTKKLAVLTEQLTEASREAAKPQRGAAVMGTKGIFRAPRIALSANERVNQKAQNVSGLMREEETTELLNYTIRGQLDEVRQCLRCNRDLVYARGDVTDLSGRYFQNITGFQYAIWSGDEELWNVFLEFLSEIGAYNQLVALTKESSNIRQTHGSPLSFFEPLLTAYRGYLDNYAARSDAQRAACWQKEVGGAQRNMPSWFIYVFSEEGAESAWPAKKMTSGFTRNGAHLKTWFEQEYNNGKCGVTFAFYRAGRGSGGRGGMSRAYVLSACADAGELDLNNTITLKRECTKKLAALTKRLERASKTALNTSSAMANRK